MTSEIPSLPIAGHETPASLSRYYELLDRGDRGGAAACFSEDALYALPLDVLDETADQRVFVGRRAIADRFTDRVSVGSHEIRLCVLDEAGTGGPTALLEAAVIDTHGETVFPFVATASIRDGLICRYVAYTGEYVPDAVVGAAGGESPASTDARAVVDRYFALLDAGDFAGAVACFSPTVVYSHPPYRHLGGKRRVTFRGSAELLAGFEARGRQPLHHTILHHGQAGRFCLFEGAVPDLPDGRSGGFISSLTLDADGRIDRYLSMYREPAIGMP